MDPQPARQAARPDVVRPLSRAAARTCARPGCPSPAGSTLTFRYDARRVLLDDLADVREPESYDLCVGHAERTGPPNGWTLEDRRRDPEIGPAGSLGGERTVALLAQMLGRDREEPGTPADAEIESDGGPDAGSDGGARADAW